MTVREIITRAKIKRARKQTDNLIIAIGHELNIAEDWIWHPKDSTSEAKGFHLRFHSENSNGFYDLGRGIRISGAFLKIRVSF